MSAGFAAIDDEGFDFNENNIFAAVVAGTLAFAVITKVTSPIEPMELTSDNFG